MLSQPGPGARAVSTRPQSLVGEGPVGEGRVGEGPFYEGVEA